MTRKHLLDTALTLCTVGGAVFAIGATSKPLSRFIAFPDTAVAVFIISGAVLGVLGATAFVLSFAIDQIRDVVTQVVYGDADARYICTYAQPSELRGLHELYKEYFRADVPDPDLMLSWVAKCSSAFTIVHRMITNESGLPTRQEMVGSFKVLPLSREGVRAIELGQASGSNFRSEHICSGRRRAVGYYVGDVVATT